MYTRGHEIGSQDNDFGISRASSSVEGKAALRFMSLGYCHIPWYIRTKSSLIAVFLWSLRLQ